MAGHRSLIAWKLSMDLAVKAFALGRTLREQRQYDLARQVERCAVSIPANVAEGYGRSSALEMARFVDIATGSLREFDTYLEVIKRLQLIGRQITTALMVDADEIGRVLFGLKRAARSAGARWRPKSS